MCIPYRYQFLLVNTYPASIRMPVEKYWFWLVGGKGFRPSQVPIKLGGI